jgi:hypothetical protein
MRYLSFGVLLAILGTTSSCGSQKQALENRVLNTFYPGLRVGMELEEVVRAYPNLRFQPYYGFIADTSSENRLFGQLGVQVSALAQQSPPSMQDRAATFHLFASSGASEITVKQLITQTLGRPPEMGCGGRSRAIRVWHWPPSEHIALLYNPSTADGEELVLLVISSRHVAPESLVTDYVPEPCSARS